MTQADIVIDPSDMELDEASRTWVDSEDCDPTNRRNVEIFTEFSQRDPEGKVQRIVLRFCCSPVEIEGDGKVERVVVGRNELAGDGDRIKASDSGERETIEAGLVLRSIGYRGEPLEGVPFDEGRGLIPNEAGRVGEGGEHVPGPLRRRLDQARPLRRDRHQQEGRRRDRRQGLRGPRGRARSPSPSSPPTPASIESLLAERAPDHVTYEGWKAIDAAEVAAGEPHGRPRVKFVSIDEMVAAAKSGAGV